ncbi:MAG: hypothetical protein V7603_5182 [Micromonosporaceae bacterium]
MTGHTGPVTLTDALALVGAAVAVGGIGLAWRQTLIARQSRDDARKWRQQDQDAQATAEAAAADAAQRRRVGVRYRYELTDAQRVLDQLNDIACRVITKQELLTEARKNELHLADLTTRVGDLGSRLPDPLKDLLEGCDSTGDGVHHWAGRLLAAPFDTAITVAPGNRHDAGMQAITQYEAAISLDRAIDMARETLRDLLAD